MKTEILKKFDFDKPQNPEAVRSRLITVMQMCKSAIRDKEEVGDYNIEEAFKCLQKMIFNLPKRHVFIKNGVPCVIASEESLLTEGKIVYDHKASSNQTVRHLCEKFISGPVSEEEFIKIMDNSRIMAAVSAFENSGPLKKIQGSVEYKTKIYEWESVYQEAGVSWINILDKASMENFKKGKSPKELEMIQKNFDSIIRKVMGWERKKWGF